MKFAFMTFSTPGQTLDEVLATARQYGYDGVEPRVSDAQRHGIDAQLTAPARQRVRGRFASSGVAMCCLAVSCGYSDPATVTEQVRQTEAFLDLAGDLGCPRLRVFGGKMAESLSRADAVRQVADALRHVADRARDRGVIVCLETHDDWTNPADVVAVMEAVDHPSVAVNWDVMHPQRVSGWSIDEAHRALRPWIRHVHVHDGALEHGKLTFKPFGQGDIDHRRVMELLMADGYDGFVSGEWIGWEPPEVHLPRELATLRAYTDGGTAP